MIISAFPAVTVTANASGAFDAARRNQVIIIVDVIDMSTTLEAALDLGACAVFGASPAGMQAPVPLNPERVGFAAGRMAVHAGTEVVLVTEPRLGTLAERLACARPVLAGINRASASVAMVVPNLGLETARLADFRGKVVIAVTSSGGVAFDAALNAGGTVLTGTVARTVYMKGLEPALRAAQRAARTALEQGAEIAVVAASAKAWEDVLAARCIAGCITEKSLWKSE